MHLLAQTIAAAVASPWIIPGPMMETPGLGLALTFSSNANLTVSVQHTLDDPEQNPRTVTLSRTTTVLTITDNGHNLNVGDNIVLSNPTNDPNNIWSGGGPPAVGTSYEVATIVDQNNYTVTVANSGSAAGNGAVRSFRVFPHSTLAGVTGSPPARADGVYTAQIGAVRLKCTAYTAGTATLTVQQGKGY